MVTKLYSCFYYGIESNLLEIEVDIQRKAKAFEIVGLAGMAVKESVKRIEAAIDNSDYHFPGKRIIVNLAPAGIRKIGTLFDLPIAIGILNEQFQFDGLQNELMIGELALDGTIRPVSGALPIAIQARKMGFNRIICPEENSAEISVVEGIRAIPVNNLKETVSFLLRDKDIEPAAYVETVPSGKIAFQSKDMSDVKGQHAAKRALEIAAAGNHNLLMIGPPGTGKTLLAKRLPTILPPMSRQEAIETTMVYSVAGFTNKEAPLILDRPFRSPHHTASDVSIVGGGKFPHPGEISLAHNGVLFLDELQLFHSNVLQVLRQPLEDRKITITRAEGSVDFPARFMLATALNPNRDNNDIDRWNPRDMQVLMRRISGPFLDRIDLHIQVSKIRYDQIRSTYPAESSIDIRERVARARSLQFQRFQNDGIYTNSEMTHPMVERYCSLSRPAQGLLRNAMERLSLSIRSHDKILKIARTIADLQRQEEIGEVHISEALQYRVLDRILNVN